MPRMKAQKAKVSGASRLGRPPKDENQRERILQEAAKVIATIGYERCSLGLVAKNLNLTRPALYHYFSDKQQIFDEIVVSLTRGMYEHVSEHVDAFECPARQLRALMIAHADYFETHYWRFVAGSTGYGGVSRAHLVSLGDIEVARTRYEKLLRKILRDGMKQGDFVKVDVKTTVLAIYSLLNMVRWYRPEGPRRASEYAEEFFAMIYEGIGAKR